MDHPMRLRVDTTLGTMAQSIAPPYSPITFGAITDAGRTPIDPCHGILRQLLSNGLLEMVWKRRPCSMF